MSHKQQRDFITKLKEKFPNNFKDIKMLEIGSLDINGSIREYFENCNYIGYDVGEGKLVDVVYDGITFRAEDVEFDTTGSCNCFEHNPNWVSNFKDMHRILKSGGLHFISVPTTGCPEHGTEKEKSGDSPLTIAKGEGWKDYYKNLTEEDFRENFNLDEMFSEYKFEVNDEVHDLYFYGIKK